jgi:hypothetical protein
MSEANSTKGQCACGAVEVTVKGDPVIMGYCHCRDCRDWSAAPINAFTIWPKDAVTVTKGANNLDTYERTDRSKRTWCKTCGGHVLTEHPHMGVIDVYAATIADFPFKPALHVHYQETVMHVKDGLPKMKDVPKDFGGSGETLPE